MKRGEHHLYIPDRNLDIRYVHIDEETVDELMLLKDGVCRMNREHDAETYADYSLEDDFIVKVLDDYETIGYYDYQGFEEASNRFRLDQNLFVDVPRLLHNIDSSIARYSPNSAEEFVDHILQPEHSDWVVEQLHETDYTETDPEHQRNVERIEEHVD